MVLCSGASPTSTHSPFMVIRSGKKKKQIIYFFCGGFPTYPEILQNYTKPESNPGSLPRKSGAPPLSHYLFIKIFVKLWSLWLIKYQVTRRKTACKIFDIMFPTLGTNIYKKSTHCAQVNFFCICVGWAWLSSSIFPTPLSTFCTVNEWLYVHIWRPAE